MIKDITTPTKNLNTDDLLKERVDITIDTTKKEIQDVSEEQNAIPEEGIEVAGGIKNILETITTTKTKDKTSQIKDIKGDKVAQDDLKDFSMDSLESAAQKKQKMEEILDDRNIPESQLVKEQQGQVVMDIVDNVDYDALGSIMARFEDIPIEQLEGNVEDIFKRLDSGGPDQIDNLDDLIKFSFEDVIKQQGGNKTVTNEDLRKIADSLNLPDLYRKVLKRKEGDLLSNAEIYKGIEESLVMRKLYIKSIEDLKADPNNRELLEKANKYFRLYGLFLSKITGDVSETARKLRATSLANQTFGKIDTDELSTVLDSIKVLNDADPADMLSYHKRFLALPLNKQSDMVQKGMFRKIVDGGIEVFVNSLLASPITHVVNFVSNMGFNALRYTENFIASGLNKIPGYKDPDGVMFSEAMELFHNFKDANKVAGEYFIDAVKRGGQAPESKLDLGSHRAVSTDVLHPSWKDPNNKLKYAMGKTLNAYGHIARLPGTFLVASDEMTKGALYVIAQKQLARRRYNEVINTGGTDEQAQAAAYKVMTDPTVADQNIIKQEGLTGTFQGDLPEGFLKNFQQTLNHPGFKVFVPFYKTVTNIFLEQAKRNPVLAWLTKKQRDDFLGRNGKRAMQLSHARLLTGTSIMSSFAMMTYDGGEVNDGGFFITGHLPYNRAKREAYQRKGIQAYSICTKKDAGNVQCISYSRFEPISALLAIAADTAQALHHPGQWGDADTWDEKSLQLVGSAITAIVPYLTEQPFLTIFSDFKSAFQRFEYSNEDNKLDAFSSFFIKKILAVGSPYINPMGSMGRYIEKMNDPKIYDKGLSQDQVNALRDSDLNISQATIAFYEELNKMQKDNPFINKELPPLLNLWGEEVTGAKGTIISPFKVVDTKFNAVDDFMIKYGFGIRMPDRKIQGIYLSVEEYNQMIKLMNDPKGNGDTLLGRLNVLIKNETFLGLPVGQQIKQFKNVVSQYKSFGKQKFFELNPKIKNRIDEMDELFKETGKRR